MNLNEKKNSLVGSWSSTITAVDMGVTAPGLLSFTSDGIVLGDEPPNPFETTAHGNWVSTGALDAAYTFLFLTGSPEGKLSSKGKVTGALHYDATADGWSGPFKIWMWDAAGKQIMTDHGTITCTRIAVEKLD
jgi:hypothetical protein